MKHMYFRKPKIGIAFGGGGARGFAHIGVIKALEEYNIKFDYVTGTSAGSIIGACYANGMTYEQIYHIAKNIKTKDIKNSKVLFIPSKTENIENLIKSAFGDIDIQDLKLPFSAVAVDIKSTNQVVISKGNLARAIAGSCCVPMVFQPVEFEDFLLCDGGLQNTIPADIARFYGCDYVVAVDVNKERTYGTTSSKLLDVLSCSVRILMKSNAIRGYIYADVMVAPETKRFKSTEAKGIDEMIDEGYKACVDVMPEILALFKKKKKRIKFNEDKKDIIFYK